MLRSTRPWKLLYLPSRNRWRIMKILLVHPEWRQDDFGFRLAAMPEPLGLEMLAAAVSDHEVRILDMRCGGDLVGRVAVPEAEPAVSRLGGDEFTILLSSISQPEDAAEVARRILDSLPSPVSIDGHKVSTTGSIGIAIYPLDGEDVEIRAVNHLFRGIPLPPGTHRRCKCPARGLRGCCTTPGGRRWGC